MAPIHSDTTLRGKPPLTLFPGGFEKRDNETVKTLRLAQENLTLCFINGLSQDSEEAQAAILDDYFRTSFGVSEAGFKLDLISNPYAIIATGSYGRKEICRNPEVSILFIFKI